MALRARKQKINLFSTKKNDSFDRNNLLNINFEMSKYNNIDSNIDVFFLN